MKQMRAINGIFLDFVICEPTDCPIFIIETSAPRVKRIIPETRRAAPMRNMIINFAEESTIVMERIRTMVTTGITAFRDSLSF